MAARSDASDRLLAELDAMLALEPAEDAPAAPPPPDPAPAAVPGREEPLPDSGPPRIVVAEDNTDYRSVVRYLLAEQGYHVAEAKDGREGLDRILEHRPDLVLLDFDMPGLNGYELLEELRSREETRKIPVIMITGTRHRRQLKEMDLCLAAFLEKPVSNAGLLDAVADALRKTPPRRREAQAAPPPAPAPEPLPPAPAEAGPRADEETPAPAPPAEPPDDLLIEVQSREEAAKDDAGLEVAADSPVIAWVNRLVLQAVEMNGSDIHIEPQERRIVVRVRRDGSLKPLTHFPAAFGPAIAARIKIMANLVITERRRPQDGQFRATVKGRKVEFRVSTLPSLYGEKVVIRILGGAKLHDRLEELGESSRDCEAWTRALASPHGLILVTGPTGSGKTTTLYTMMSMLNRPDVNIMTAEDPVEYELAGITQTAVKPHLGLTFEAVLRSFLRQDPDVMLVGEIRDLETADIAVKAAITGHLVFSTLHTNSAAGAVQRLTHMGVPAFLLADALKLVVAQRLVKRLCRSCREPAEVSAQDRLLLKDSELALLPQAFGPRGCPACLKSGYCGRLPVFETLEIRTPAMRQTLLSTRTAGPVVEQAASEGMTTLRQAALQAVAAGETSLGEALKVIVAD